MAGRIEVKIRDAEPPEKLPQFVRCEVMVGKPFFRSVERNESMGFNLAEVLSLILHSRNRDKNKSLFLENAFDLPDHPLYRGCVCMMNHLNGKDRVKEPV